MNGVGLFVTFGCNKTRILTEVLPSCRRPGIYRGRLTDRQLSRFSSSNSDSVARKSEAAFRLYPASSAMSH
jgi:hypothetical protein